jgi:hypothetical protein
MKLRGITLLKQKLSCIDAFGKVIHAEYLNKYPCGYRPGIEVMWRNFLEDYYAELDE